MVEVDVEWNKYISVNSKTPRYYKDPEVSILVANGDQLFVDVFGSEKEYMPMPLLLTAARVTACDPTCWSLINV